MNLVWYFVLWTLAGLFEFSDHLPGAWNRSEAPALCAIALIIAYLWALMAPALFALTQRFPIERPNAGIHAVAHVAFTIAFSVCVIFLSSVAMIAFGVGKSMMTMSLTGVFVPTFVYSIHFQIL